MPTLPTTGSATKVRPMTRRSHPASWGLGAILTLGLLGGCGSSATPSSSSAAELGPTVTLTSSACTYSGSTSVTAEDGSLAIPVSNDSEFPAVVSLLRVGSAFEAVESDVDSYNDAESVGEPFELTPDPGVTEEAQVQVDPSGASELASDVEPDTYAVLCTADGLDEAFLFGPVEVTE